ncbi:hypothetical protein GCM10017772_44050 [Promicromonospora soli]|uniref:Uncharacterized protein n=1 Tax=Promicromonospora soli TaxID=2035533 RepID=A0A919G873_9MICO|nr:hypothetical protein GCM10017772_44050 [Promicromonospora soli]
MRATRSAPSGRPRGPAARAAGGRTAPCGAPVVVSDGIVPRLQDVGLRYVMRDMLLMETDGVDGVNVNVKFLRNQAIFGPQAPALTARSGTLRRIDDGIPVACNILLALPEDPRRAP